MKISAISEHWSALNAKNLSELFLIGGGITFNNLKVRLELKDEKSNVWGKEEPITIRPF